jgi:DNA-directed RNA polymerase specialized sigma24 family protein
MQRAEEFNSLEQALEEGKAYVTRVFIRYRMPDQDWGEVMNDCLLRIWKDWEAGERIRLKVLRRSLYPFKDYVGRDAVTGKRKAPGVPIEDRFTVFRVSYQDLEKNDPLLSINTRPSAELEFMGRDAGLELLDLLDERQRKAVFLRYWLDWELRRVGLVLKPNSRRPAELAHKVISDAMVRIKEGAENTLLAI